MQYLECLASTLHDMAFTFQPAASMSSVLQAVMLELQNASSKTPPPEGQYAQSDSVAIPATRRDSSSRDRDEEDVRTFKKRQLSKSSTRPARIDMSASSSSSSAKFTPQLTNTDIVPASLTAPFLEADMDRRDGYVMITPRSERTAWPSLDANLNALDYPMTTFGGMNAVTGNLWMDAGEGLSPFPMSGDGNGTIGGASKNHELDFFSF